MKKFIYGSVVTLALFGMVLVPSAPAHAETTAPSTIESMLAQIQVLMAKLADLQKQFGIVKSDIREVLKDGLKEGMSDADILKIQELLATDPTIYPEGKVTGYFGPLTKEALKRFQARHGATTTGEIDEDTRDLLEEYLHEGFGDTIPPGLLRAPGIMKKVQDRLHLECAAGTHVGMGPLCKKYHDEDADDEENDDDEDDNSNDNGFDIEVEIEDGTTTVSFQFEDDNYDVEVDSTDVDDVLDAVADAIDEGDDAADLDEDLSDAIEEAFNDADDEADADAAEAEDNAQEALDDAQDEIDNAQDEIDGDNGDNTDEAQDILDDAQDKLDDAQDAFDADDFEEAEDLADDAADLAQDAQDAL